MKHRLSLDIEGVSRYEHRVIAENIKAICPELDLTEADSHAPRAIDAENINLIAGIISAICAVIGLLLQYFQVKNQNSIPNEKMEIIFAEVQTRLNIEIPHDVQVALRETLSTRKSAAEIELEIHKVAYRLNIFVDKNSFHIQGRPSKRTISKIT